MTLSGPTRQGRVVPFVLMLVFSGCASYRLESLAVSHPAHPDGPAAPVPPASRTLVYTPADAPSARPTPSGAVSQPDGQGARPPQSATSPRVVGEGEVVATVPNANQIVLDHGEIAGFMDAMTMGYRVDPPSLLAGLQPGDRIRFTIDVPRRAIVDIEKLP